MIGGVDNIIGSVKVTLAVGIPALVIVTVTLVGGRQKYWWD
jgi:hypothetical protein